MTFRVSLDCGFMKTWSSPSHMNKSLFSMALLLVLLPSVRSTGYVCASLVVTTVP